MRRVLVLLVITLASCKSHEQQQPKPGAGSAPTPPPATAKATAAFVDVTVLPMDSDKELEHQTVLVDGTKITAVGPTASTPVPAGAKTIDGKGKWLVPGLIDMHVHFNDESYGTLFVANGVTTVRNMWGNEDTLGWRAKARANDASYFGPSIYTAGAIVDGDPPRWPGSHVVHDAKEAEAEVAAQAKAGYDFIKVYDGLTLPAYDAIAAAAKQSNLRFAGHIPKAAGLVHAIELGQASIEHLTGFFGVLQDGKGPAAGGGVLRDMDPQVVAHLDATKLPALAKQLADAKIANVPTLVVLQRFAALDHPDELRARAENKYVPAPLLASWDPKQDFRTKSMTPAMFEAMRTGNQFRMKIVKALLDANAPILVGTDTPNPFIVPGFSIHEELQLLTTAGLSPYQALRGATSAAADWLHDTSAGRIEAGARADLVLLDADPLKDISATTKRAGVMVRGAWYTQQQLQAKLDELVAGYAGGATERLAKAPALQIPAGELVFQASFTTKYAGQPVGEERMAIVKTEDGGRIIVAQAAGDPPGPKLGSVQVELDKAGHLRSFIVEEDGKRAIASLSGDKLHVIVNGATTDTPFPADGLLDANLAATMIPFADRAKPGAKTKVSGKVLSGTGKLSDLSYTFDRTGKGTAIPFTATGPFGEAPGTYEVDAKGFPTKISVKAGPGELTVTRH